METIELRELSLPATKNELNSRRLTDVTALLGCGIFMAISVGIVIINGTINDNFVGKDDPFDKIMLWNFEFMGTTELIAYLTFVIFIINLSILCSFIYCPKFIIWTLSIGCVIALVGFGSSVAKIKLYFGFISIFLAIATAFLIITLRHEIPAVADVFRESIKFVKKVWCICVLPILTLFIASIATRLFYQLCKIITNPDSTIYFAEITLIFTIYGYVFVVMFIFECQNFIVTGVISKAYIEEEERSLRQNVTSVMWTLVRYHLGTVSLGTLLTITNFLKVLVKNFKNVGEETAKNLKNHGLEYQVRSSYIYVIRDGKSLAESAKIISAAVSDNSMKLMPIKMYILFVHIVWRFFLFLCFTWAFVHISMEHPKLLTIFDTKSSIKYAVLLYVIGTVHGCVSLCEIIIETLIVCVTLNSNDDASKLRNKTNLNKIINSILGK